MNLKRYQYSAAIVLVAICLLNFSLPQKLNIVFIGDSITQGGDGTSAPPMAAAKFLNDRTGQGTVAFSNQGVSGCTTVDFLPATATHFKNVIQAADGFYRDKQALLIFSIMLGTNDSAIEGPLGSPVSADSYGKNLQSIIDDLLARYPDCRIVIHRPLWYSPNTYNHSKYLQDGLDRLQSYFPVIDRVIDHYSKTNKGQVLRGDRHAYTYFKKNHLALMNHEDGQQGVFYLHPNLTGSADLGHLWAKAIVSALSTSRAVQK